MVCILYTIMVGTCLTLAGLLIERVLPPRWPRRWLWLAVVVLSMAIPPVYYAQHHFVVAETAQVTAQPTWWAVVSRYDATIMRVWRIASIGLLVWGVASVASLSLLVRRSRRGRRVPTFVDGIPVALTDTLGPATVGLLRPRVVIPRWVLRLPATQREYVLRHEEEHRRAYDTQLLFLSSLPLILAPWYLPLYWQLRRLSLAVETDCDNRVIDALGNPSAYGELLLDIAAASHGRRLQPGLLGGAGMLERRLRKLVAYQPLTRIQRYLLPTLAIGLLYLVLSTPHPVLARHVAQSTSSHATAHK